jgi:hypothetical protein
MARDPSLPVLPIGRTMRAAHVRAREVGGGDGAVKPGELVEASFVDGASFSTAARKVHVLLLAKAAGDAWEDRWHTITKAELQQAHQATVRLQDVMDELMSTFLRVRVVDENGLPEVLSGAIVDGHKIAVSDSAKARIRWKFSDAMREVMRRSDYYAELKTQIVAALESRYSVTLYELGCAYYRRDRPIWSGTVDEFRTLIGVPNTYRDWTDIRRRTLDAARAELDFLAPFSMSWSEVRRGRAVERVEIIFRPKDDQGRADAAAELQRSRVGRKARRSGTVEQIAAAPPALAPIQS